MLKVVELFAGVGTQRMALKRLGIEHDVVAISEIDPYAINSYKAIHGDTLNLGDISKINPQDVPDCDLLTYSYPCTNISIAGSKEGLAEGSGTASSLLWYCRDIVEHKKPKYLLMENVKNLVGKKFKPYFLEWCKVLEDFGYTNYYKVLNAKHYGVPQNRERVFMVSILGEHEPYEFPNSDEVTSSLWDILVDDYDDKYLLSKDIKTKFVKNVQEKIQCKGDIRVIGNIYHNESSNNYRGVVYDPNYHVGSLLSSDWKDPKKTIYPATRDIGNIYNNTHNSQAGRVYGKDGQSPSLSTMNGGNRQPKVIEGSFDFNDVDSFEIRKLTPLECWRLMGISDEDFNKVRDLNSDTQLYKQAGNAIVVDVLVDIFRNLFKER